MSNCPDSAIAELEPLWACLPPSEASHLRETVRHLSELEARHAAEPIRGEREYAAIGIVPELVGGTRLGQAGQHPSGQSEWSKEVTMGGKRVTTHVCVALCSSKTRPDFRKSFAARRGVKPQVWRSRRLLFRRIGKDYVDRALLWF